MSGGLFLTGGSGFLGARVAALLAKSCPRLVCLGRRPPAVKSRNVEFVPGDLTSADRWRGAMAGCDTAIHLAAATGKRPRAEYFRVNRRGTAAVTAEASRAGVRRLIFASTIAVKFSGIEHYPYAQSKREAEAIVESSGLEWTIVRPTMIFGPGSPVLDGLRRLAALPAIPVFGDGHAAVQPVYVDDLAAGIAALAEEAPARQTLEIGGPEAVPIEELLLRIRRSLGLAGGRVVHLPARPASTVLSWMERLFGAEVLPLTAGQVASFTNDGTAMGMPWPVSGMKRMTTLEEMLRPASRKNGSA